MVIWFSMCFLKLGELGFVWFILLMYLFFQKKMFIGAYLSDLFVGDFLGVSMQLLTVIVFFLMVLSSSFDFFKSNSWFSFLVVLSFFFLFLCWVFMCSSFIIFYLAFEMAVVPIFILIIGWGYSVNRLQAAVYMFLYTFLSSIPFLIFLLFFYIDGHSFVFLNAFYSTAGGFLGSYFWFLFCLVFMVKLPVFFFHLWLPKAHVEAPLLGSMVLAGVLLKLGGYGLFKAMMLSFLDFVGLMVFLTFFCLLGGCYVGLMCLRQTDLKSLVAYSSVVHMSPVIAAFLLFNFYGFWGGLMMMFSHGLCSSCLFFILNLSYLKLSSRSYLLNRGGLLFFPFLSFIWLVFCITNMGFPPTLSFFSELFIVMSVFSYSYFVVFLVFFMMLLSGFYSVMLYLFFNHGESKNFFNYSSVSMSDLMVVLISMFYLFFFILYCSSFLCLLIFSLWY